METYIVPDRHDKDQGLRNGFVKGGEASDLTVAVAIIENGELVLAELGGNGAGAGKAVELGAGNLDLLAVLDEELGELVLLELGHDTVLAISQHSHEQGDLQGPLCLRELLAGIDGLALAVEVGVAHAVRVVVAAVGVTVTGEALGGVSATAVGVLADVVVIVLASVGSESERVGVGFPDVDLCAASTVRANTGIRIVGGGDPIFNVGLSTKYCISIDLLHLSLLPLLSGRGSRVALPCRQQTSDLWHIGHRSSQCRI